MRALGAVRDAARLDDVAKQTEIGEIETHGNDLPSDLTKSGLQYRPLCNAISRLFFVYGEVVSPTRRPGDA
jgi:hypothetical protein